MQTHREEKAVRMGAEMERMQPPGKGSLNPQKLEKARKDPPLQASEAALLLP